MSSSSPLHRQLVDDHALADQARGLRTLIHTQMNTWYRAFGDLPVVGSTTQKVEKQLAANAREVVGLT